jgi:hypothetical protein
MRARSIWLGLVAAAALPSASQAGTPFAGTWVAEPQKTEFSARSLELSIEHGIYKRLSCAVADEVAADGAVHPLTGDPYFDAMFVRVVDESNVELVQQTKGRTTWQGHYSVASDRRSMTLIFTDDRPARTVSGTIQFEREGDPNPGAYSLSGVWQAKKLLELAPSGSTLTFQDTEHGLIMNASDGRSFDIKYGGSNNEPLQGYLDGARVHVGRRSPNMLQINRTQDGALVEFTLGEVSDDGQQMAFGQIDWPCQSKTTLMYRKQAKP